MLQGVFIPARDDRFYLLQAHRQPLPANLIASYIERLSAPGDLILDPFAASDALVRAAIERGRRVIAVESNPLVAFATRLQATLPPARELNAALARLGETRKEGESLRVHIEKLYTSVCARCGTSVTVEYFVYRREGERIMAVEKAYTCPQCGAQRADATEEDRQRANEIPARGLHYHLLVQRLIADDAQHDTRIRRLLGLYTPRNLYALATVTQKLDAEFRDDATYPILQGFLLHALDVGTSLYPFPGGEPQRERPTEFVEVNIWRALERAARGLSEHAPALRLVAHPAQVVQARTPAAFIAHGSARALADTIAGANAALILSSPARLDPTFWELSFLWTRWLFGKNTAAALEPLLEEKRQRWGWYGAALTHALTDAAALTREGGYLALAFPSGSHAMIEALMLAAAPMFALQEFAFRPQRGAWHSTEFGALRGEYRVVWTKHESHAPAQPGAEVAKRLRAGALQAALEILDRRGEPLAYSWLHHAALDQLARAGALAETMHARLRAGDNPFQFLRHRLEEGFKEGYVHEFDHWHDKQGVLWFKRQDADRPLPLSERVEVAAREILQSAGRLRADEFEDALLARFPGLLTPEIELVELCAQAYADWVDGEWVWRASDVDAQLSRARTLLVQLGVRLGFDVCQDIAPFDLVWRAEKVIPGSSAGSVHEQRVWEDVYGFLFRARADFGDLVARRVHLRHGFVIIPETQVALTRERLRRDPLWLKRLERAGWEFLRVPFVEMLLQEEWTERPEFQLAWGLDPPLARGKEQMELF